MVTCSFTLFSLPQALFTDNEYWTDAPFGVCVTIARVLMLPSTSFSPPDPEI